MTARGTLLAFAEGRKGGGGDAGDIDLLVAQHRPGPTWSPQQTVWDDGRQHLRQSRARSWTATPAPSGCCTTWNRGDDPEPQDHRAAQARTPGACLSPARPTTATPGPSPARSPRDVKATDWTWYATGPGAGIQIGARAAQGRLVIPCDHIEAGTKRYYSHVIYSDDHGQTWKLGGSTPRDQVNECEVVELAGGRLMLNMRNYDRAQRTRQVAISDDGGPDLDRAAARCRR